jgi:hypothetical protein
MPDEEKLASETEEVDPKDLDEIPEDKAYELTDEPVPSEEG